MWGIRAIVPKSLQSQVLKELHQEHPGISRMKDVWWPKIDSEIEEIIQSCRNC